MREHEQRLERVHTPRVFGSRYCLADFDGKDR
jgi:hypothetical protein